MHASTILNFSVTNQSQEIKLRLEMLRQERQKWRNHSRMQVAMAAAKQGKPSQDAKLKQIVKTTKSRAEQFQLLTKAMALKLKGN